MYIHITYISNIGGGKIYNKIFPELHTIGKPRRK